MTGVQPVLSTIFPNLPPDADQFSFTTDVFRAWQPGQAGRDNGAMLFVFVREHHLWIQTGRGLEGALPDALCKRITADVIAPAFKAGQFDVKLENSSKDWATGYDSPALRAGLIKKEEIPNGLPSGMQGFAYNLRRPLFQDARVREALAYAFDFEWSNKNLFYSAYKRTRSYFDNSELAAIGMPQGEELKILEKFRGQIPDQVFTAEYDPPKYDGSGNIRNGVRAGLKLLKEAGWTFKGEKLVNDETGQPFEFEILLDNPQFERIVLPFAKNLERMGITHAAFEASSHGLAQYRTEGLPVCAAAFTNFSRDHLDYHGTMEAYFEAKMRLFEDVLEPGAKAVVWTDDPKSDEVIERARERGHEVLTVGRKGGTIRLVEQSPTALGQPLQRRLEMRG